MVIRQWLQAKCTSENRAHNSNSKHRDDSYNPILQMKMSTEGKVTSLLHELTLEPGLMQSLQADWY